MYIVVPYDKTNPVTLTLHPAGVGGGGYASPLQFI